MGETRFPLSSDQLELLLQFEATASLGDLARQVRRDPSVVSRNLQRLAQDAPVLAKQEGRWRITPAGREINSRTRVFLAEIAKLASAIPRVDAIPERAALMIVNAQQAFVSSARGAMSPVAAPANMVAILAAWRRRGWPILHARHLSSVATSAFHPGAASAAFIKELAPGSGEIVIAKSTASAFNGTALAGHLELDGIESLVLIGYTANVCVDATAQSARDLGYATFVVSDATAMFDIVGPDGKVFEATRTQEALMANLHATGVTIVQTDVALRA